MCGSNEHKEKCDSPGAIIMRMTGCPSFDARMVDLRGEYKTASAIRTLKDAKP
jgi:hypothetical protein